MGLSACENSIVGPQSDNFQFEITFYTDSETVFERLVLETGDYLTEPTNPSKEGYEFAGWYTDLAFSNEFSFSDPIYTSLDLYAKWNIAVDTFGVKIYPDLEPVLAALEVGDSNYVVIDVEGKMVGFDQTGLINWMTGLEIPDAISIEPYEMVLTNGNIKVIGRVLMTVCDDENCLIQEEKWLPFIATVSKEGVLLHHTINDSVEFEGEQFSRIFALGDDGYVVYGFYANDQARSKLWVYNKDNTLLWNHDFSELMLVMEVELDLSDNIIVHCSSPYDTLYQQITFDSQGVLTNQEQYTYTYNELSGSFFHNILVKEDKALFYDHYFVIEFAEESTIVHDYSSYKYELFAISELLELPDGTYILIARRAVNLSDGDQLYKLHLNSDLSLKEVIEYDNTNYSSYTAGLVNSNGNLVLFGYTLSTQGLFSENSDETGAFFIEIINTTEE
jgi:uncharacterized repeat protein (TIGR02543 family)